MKYRIFLPLILCCILFLQISSADQDEVLLGADYHNGTRNYITESPREFLSAIFEAIAEVIFIDPHMIMLGADYFADNLNFITELPAEFYSGGSAGTFIKKVVEEVIETITNIIADPHLIVMGADYYLDNVNFIVQGPAEFYNSNCHGTWCRTKPWQPGGIIAEIILFISNNNWLVAISILFFGNFFILAYIFRNNPIGAKKSTSDNEDDECDYYRDRREAGFTFTTFGTKL